MNNVVGGVCNIFLAYEPLTGKRLVTLTERATKDYWALFLEQLADRYRDADKMRLMMDNLYTHEPGALSEMFSPEKAKALWGRFYFVHTPKQGVSSPHLLIKSHNIRWLALHAEGLCHLDVALKQRTTPAI